ncbi:MAG: AAA family ATPase [Methylococcaceae bacterium]|nr:AAA family ATPase [Methylococcaceae bacterium]
MSQITLQAVDHRREYLPIVRRIRLRALRRAQWLRHLWEKNAWAGEQGMAISHAEIDHILGDPGVAASEEKVFYEALKKENKQIHEADCEVAQDPRWAHLCGQFGLSEYESDLLSLALAAEILPNLRRVYGYLNDDTAACHPNVHLASCLFDWLPGHGIRADSLLIKWRLAAPTGDESPWSPLSPWKGDSIIAHWLLTGNPLDHVQSLPIEYCYRNRVQAKPCLYPELRDEILQFLDRVGKTNKLPALIEFSGLPGSGKRTLASQICADLERDLLVVDCWELAGFEAGAAIDAIIRAIRASMLTGAAVYWHGAEALDEKIWRKIKPHAALSFATSANPIQSGVEQGNAIHRAYGVPFLSRSKRVEAWRHLTKREEIPEAVNEWTLTPVEIKRIVPLAFLGGATVNEACRNLLHRESSELFASLPCPYTWSDIVLQAAVKRQLEELEAQAKLRCSVYEDWGFGKLCPLGKGISALFAGPSGTGKTMAAQVLTRSLERELYRVDLSAVVNKYIGETEKRLKKVFDDCERSGVVLFFDEADALFGNRTQVKDAHDRFANIEVDYLLQRMEQFNGVAILATNRKNDVDTAFLRRLRFIVDFVPPGFEERLALWKKALPETAPDGEIILDAIDWSLLADKLPMTGADIKNAAIGAAFLAKSAGIRIRMGHVIYAARREMAKQGITLRSSDWQELEAFDAKP